MLSSWRLGERLDELAGVLSKQLWAANEMHGRPASLLPVAGSAFPRRFQPDRGFFSGSVPASGYEAQLLDIRTLSG
jgi:hypothetical protein